MGTFRSASLLFFRSIENQESNQMAKKNKLLICGATGFVGRNMVEYFADNPDYEVHATHNMRPKFQHQNVRWHKANLTNEREVGCLLAKIKPDQMVQAAATTSGAKDIVSRPYIHVTDNAVMNSYLFRSAVEHGVKHVLFFSCTVMYQSSVVPIKETDYDANLPVHPRYFGVAHTKLYLEKMCEFYSSLGETKFTVVRHSNVFGPYDKYDFERSHFFGANVSKVMTSDGKISVWGTGEEERDLMFVSDLCRFIDFAIAKQKAPYQMYHCGSGQAYSVLDVVKMIIAASGKNIEITHDLSMPTIKTSLCLDCSLANKELGWQAETQLMNGIEDSIAWWKNNIDPKTLALRYRES